MTVKGKAEDTTLMNEKIHYDRLQLITHEGANLGVVSRADALRLAREAGLDLVVIAEKGADQLPVAKIMNYGKISYEKKKQQATARKKQKVIQIKEIQVRPKIGEHDFQTKINKGIALLQEGKYLKISLIFRGREAAMRNERGQELFDKVDQAFEQAGISKNVVQDQDSKMPSMWARVYYLK